MDAEFTTLIPNDSMIVNPETEFQIEQTDLFQKVARQKEKGEEPAALFSDFDGTLFSGDISKTAGLVNLAKQKDVPVIPVTGRGALALKALVDGFVAEYNQQHPDQPVEEINFDAIIGAVGTEIYIAKSKDGKTEYKKDEKYERQMIEQGFVRPEIARKVAELVTELSELHPELSIDYQDAFVDVEKEYLTGNVGAKVQPFKISLNFNAKDTEEVELVRKHFEDKFPTLMVVISQAVIYNSDNQDERKQYCLDILPVTKADAVDYLAKKVGVSQGLVAGDSGNDSTMLADSENLEAVLVGGHKPEARNNIDQSIVDNPDRRGRKFQTISSRNGGSKRVYIGENDKIGPDSIIHTAEVYERAKKMKAVRDAINSSDKRNPLQEKHLKK